MDDLPFKKNIMANITISVEKYNAMQANIADLSTKLAEADKEMYALNGLYNIAKNELKELAYASLWTRIFSWDKLVGRMIIEP